MTIVEFLTARLDERESGTREALKTEDYGVSQFDLDDIAAKRRIVEWATKVDMQVERNAREHADASRRLDHEAIPTLRSAGWQVKGRQEAMLQVLRELASPYADHPDYDEDWKP